MYRTKYSPTIVENQLCLSTAILKKFKPLELEGRKAKELTFYRVNPLTGNKEITASLQVTFNSEFGNDYLKLDYVYGGQEISCIIHLQAIKSNLGKGFVYFFICPQTGKNCRKLYLHEGHFKSRKGIGVLLYYQQTVPVKDRSVFQMGRVSKKYRELLVAQFRPYYKEWYGLKKTKKQNRVEVVELKLLSLKRQITNAS
ncbi:hypothetical protein [Pseudocnuella soli]|uniref:hypothetical protein n=1 Tax=Pseudocnuella soli TaxID=2502779 RepID=UPI00105025BC|nr:hypothetical protein [Pseudocnuella soli]